MKRLIQDIRRIRITIGGRTYRVTKPIRFMIASMLATLLLSVSIGMVVTIDNCTPYAKYQAVHKK